ncbi:NEQ501 [Nanoarchaeum equitans Kin4-M]|uniref:NEQ501 n=1 Tax=Nanoarchaeum equitans (strain Kin4-M) TaxID=228908 RepID=Q74MW0_NANEQ|nr:NEQ501 [Nanoarchaeum equitans Kin4-M]
MVGKRELIEIREKIAEIERKIDLLEDKALNGILNIDEILETKKEINVLLRKINKLIEFGENTKELEKLKSYLLTLKSDLFYILDINDSVINKRINENLNKLAFISIAFAPATFVTSLYGMNFVNAIPPWETKHGFILAIIIAIISTIFSFLIVKKINLESI